jgi:hypothetical protein
MLSEEITRNTPKTAMGNGRVGLDGDWHLWENLTRGAYLRFEQTD